jgi:hypothetical protein
LHLDFFHHHAGNTGNVIFVVLDIILADLYDFGVPSHLFCVRKALAPASVTAAVAIEKSDY